MAASAAIASLLALLAANGTSQLDCICSRIHNDETENGKALWDDILGVGETSLWLYYCRSWLGYDLVGRCDSLEPPSAAVPAVARLVPWDWSYGPPEPEVGLGIGQPPAEGEECGCGAALAAIRGLTWEEAEEVECRIPDVLTEWSSAQGLNDTRWTAEILAAEHLRHQKLSQLLHAARRTMRVISIMQKCMGSHFHISESAADYASYLEQYSRYWQRSARMVPLVAAHHSQLFIPLAFEHTGNLPNDQRLHGWIKNMERARVMLDTKLRGLVHDVKFISEQITNYKVEEDKNTPGKYIIRRPLLSDALLVHQERFLSFRDDFGALCEQQQPHASQVFGLADALYSFYHLNIFPHWNIMDENDEEWLLEDQSNTTVSVDTGCLQVVADTLDRPRCPLEDLPLESSRRRRQCREQLWQDLVERSPHVPATSYLDYTQRTTVSLCLLAWMAANSYGVCQDVPFSIVQAVHDARCYFDSPDNQTCLQTNAVDAICSLSRAVLLLKCRDFYSIKKPEMCYVSIMTTGKYSATMNVAWTDEKPTLSYKESLNSATLKYKDCKVYPLKTLEYSFVAVNILFRLFTALVYMWLPHFNNLPGKSLMLFQLTGIIQAVCSEVLYRMAVVLDLYTAAPIDSCLTLLGCLWLNLLCYQLYACVRRLRLSNDLLLAEASTALRRQVVFALIPWIIVCTTCIPWEKSSRYYSQITFIVAMSTSIAMNIVFLGLVAYVYHHNKKSMQRLETIGNHKCFLNKQLTFLSITTNILSAMYVIITIGFHQAEGVAQHVYYIHIATMLQGPALYVFFVCNEASLPVLRNRILAWWRAHVVTPGLELCLLAEKYLAIRRGERPLLAESPISTQLTTLSSSIEDCTTACSEL